MNEISREMTSLHHGDAVLDGALLAHEVEDRLGTGAVGELLDCVHLPPVDLHGVICADLAGELKRLLGGIDDDDLGRRQRLQALDPVRGSPSAPRRPARRCPSAATRDRA
jgi:hypothetical protein